MGASVVSALMSVSDEPRLFFTCPNGGAHLSPRLRASERLGSIGAEVEVIGSTSPGGAPSIKADTATIFFDAMITSIDRS